MSRVFLTDRQSNSAVLCAEGSLDLPDDRSYGLFGVSAITAAADTRSTMSQTCIALRETAGFTMTTECRRARCGLGEADVLGDNQKKDDSFSAYPVLCTH